jgi:hypothetical protein
MANRTVWNKGAGVWVLLAVASFAGRVHAADDRNLNGVWQCHFLKPNSAFESSYYSIWTFNSAKKEVVIFWSPVHKGDDLAYDWDNKQLILDKFWKRPRPNVGKFKAEMNKGGELVIEDPRVRWKGWLCHRQPTEQWPPDGLQFLDYGRYPWLSGLIEDGPSIMKYQDPKMYKEWEKGLPR